MASSNRVILVEPPVNENRNIVNHEDLIIYLDLTAQIPARSILKNDPKLKDGKLLMDVDPESKVSFTFPRVSEGETPMLSTSWTEIGGKSKVSTSEGFGITNVDIQFDASFVPRVTIDFVDIRGASLFEDGADSKYYGAFFRLPYPLYYLTFKGYYGDTVSYPLHLMKFNSKFNGETGNFEIRCDFIGHTFALLSDLLMGFSIAAPYMSVGGRKDMVCPCVPDVDTVKEFINKAQKVSDDINVANSGPQRQKIEQISIYRQDLLELQRKITAISAENEANPQNSIQNIVKNKFINDPNSINKNIDFLIKENSEGFLQQINLLVKSLKTKQDSLSTPTDYKVDGKSVIFQNAKPLVKVNTTPYDEIFTKIEIQFKILESQITKELKTVGDEILASNNFNPRIKNVIEVLMCGFDIFLTRLMTTSREASVRPEKIKKILEIRDTAKVDQGRIKKNKDGYPWPLYYENDYSKGQNGAPILKYPGSNPSLRSMPEVLFVEDFISALFDTQQELNTSSELLTSGDGWIPTSMSESPLMLNTNIPIPYNNMDYNGILKKLMSRLMVQLSYTYAQGLRFSNPSPVGYYGDMFGKTQTHNQLTWFDNFMEDSMSIVDFLARAEAGIFYVTSTSQTTIDTLANKTTEQIIGDIEQLFLYSQSGGNTNKEPLYSGQSETLLYKTSNTYEVSQVAKGDAVIRVSGFALPIPANSFNPIDNTSLYYLSSTRLTEDDKIKKPIGDGVKLEINDDIIVSGYFDPTDNDSVSFNIITKGTRGTRTKPKKNEKIEDLTDGLDNINLGEGYFLTPKFSEFNVIEFFNEEEEKSSYINGDRRGSDREIQTSEKIDYYENNLVNVCLESMDKPNDKPEDNPVVKTNPNGLAYGDFPIYVKFDDDGDVDRPIYVGQIQDTQWYKLNDNVTGLFNNPIDNEPYALSDLSTAYLWLNSLELTLGEKEASDSGLVFDKLSNNTLNACLVYSSAIIEMPEVVLLWIGATLWRYEYMVANKNADPIQYGDKNILTGTAFDASTYSTQQKTDLGIHYDYLRNFAKYDESGLEDYKTKYYIDTVDFGISRSSVGFPYFTINGEEKITPIKDDVSMYSFVNAPKKIRDMFIMEFINFASSNEKGNTIVSTTWDVVKRNIEDRNLLRRHYISLNPNQLIGKTSRYLYTEDGRSYGRLRVGETPYTLTLRDNCGYLNDWDKAVFISDYYDKGDFQGASPKVEVTSSGYIVNGSVTPTTERPVYSPRLRFLNPETFSLLNVKQSVVYLLNGTWRNFIAQREGTIEATTPKEPINNYLPTFYVESRTLSKYVESFLTEVKRIREDREESEVKRPLNSIDDDNIKLDIYLKCKNLYDKWIAGNSFVDNDGICLSRFFKFRDRAMNDIGDDAMINPKSITQLFKDSNTSSYNVLYELLSQNNFDFHPLPHFTDFGNVGEKGVQRIKNMFTPQTVVRDNGITPAFICIYVGNRSDTVNLNDSEYGDNSVDFLNNERLPDDFNTVYDKNKNEKLAVFNFSFGKENQNIFKSVNFDQSEYTETAESLQVIDDLSKVGKEANAVAYKGNDLLQLYTKRSYTCQVEMLGCAVIEPLMYFQLTNVPIFSGAFMITKLSHNITPNHMTTSFSGVKIPFTNVPVITNFAVSAGLITESAGVSFTSRDWKLVMTVSGQEGVSEIVNYV